MSRYRRYPEYKDSGVEWIGEVPAHWGQQKLKFNSYIKGRIGWQNLRSDEFTDEGPYLITGMNFKDGVVDWDMCYHITEERYLIAPEIFVKEGDVLITKDGSIGKLAYIECLPGKASLNSHLLVIRPLRNTYQSRFIFYALGSDLFQSFIIREQKGTTFFGITQESVENFPAILPSLNEQITISAFLDIHTLRIDALVAKKERQLDLLKKKRQALITHAVTKGLNSQVRMKDSGVEWIGEVPKHWVVVQLGKIASDRCDGPFGSGLKSEHYASEGVRVVRLQNIGLAEFKNDNAAFISYEHWRDVLGCGHAVAPGDLLIAGLGDENNPLGRACVAPDIGNALVKADCYRFRLNPAKAISAFIALSLSATAKAECGFMATGATRDRLNLGLASSRIVVLPPIKEQQSIIDDIRIKTTPIDLLIEKTQLTIDLLKKRRSALITAAVTGQIDLREPT